VVNNMKTSRPSSPSSSLVSLAVLALAGAGCGFSVEAEIPEVEVTQHDLAFDGVPPAELVGDASMTRTFSQMHERLELPEGIDAEVHALGVTLKAKHGVQDLGFIKNLRITMADGAHEPVVVLDYEQAPGATAGTELTMGTANPINTFDQWKTDSATFTMEVGGTLPSNAWTVDLTIRFAGKARYQH
jgi:hypothetical protein